MERAAEFLSRGWDGQIDLSGGLRLVREAERIYVIAPGVHLPGAGWPQMPGGVASLPLKIPGEVTLPDGWQVVSELREDPARAMEDARNNESDFQAWADADTLPGDLEIRTRKSGDRFEPIGMGGHSMKLSDFFINEKLPQRARDAWPLICSGNTIVWVPGYRLAHPFRLTRETVRVVYFRVAKIGD